MLLEGQGFQIDAVTARRACNRLNRFRGNTTFCKHGCVWLFAHRGRVLVELRRARKSADEGQRRRRLRLAADFDPVHEWLLFR